MSQPPNIVVTFAVRTEAKPFIAAASDLPNVKVLLTGIGRRNAEQAVRMCLKNGRVDLLITSGFAGGLNPHLKVGQVVFCTPPAWHEVLVRAGARPVRFHCADRVAVTTDDKRRLHDETGADAVDMESHFIARCCGEAGIPALTVRAISDAADEELPMDFNAFMTAGGDFSFVKLAARLASSPQAIPKLVAFQKQLGIASQSLAAVLSTVVRNAPAL